MPILETDGSGSVKAVNTWGPNGLLSRTLGTGPTAPTTFYTFDLQGSVAQRLTSSGGAMDTHLFDAYGTEVSSKSLGDPFAFGAQWGYYTDQQSASDTGLVLCGWRYYDPTTGRFLTRDPAGYGGGLNLYAFAANNPVSYADPSGTNPLICGAVGAGLGALINGGLAYVHHQDVWQAVERGAVVGGVTGFFTCLGAPELGGGFLGGFASGAVGGAIGDAYGLGRGFAFGWQVCFNWPELLSSAAFGGVGGGIGGALAGGEEAAGKTAVIGGDGGAAVEGGGCFVAGTPLLMPDGTTRAVQEVKQGDWVLSKDPVTGTVAARRVLRTFVREVDQTLALTFANGEQIETTANHPFAVEGHGFVQAGQLAVGTLIVTQAGPAVKLVQAERKVRRTQVYNLEVEGFHSYFVGTGGGALWVHNVSCIDASKTYEQARNKALRWLASRGFRAEKVFISKAMATRPGGIPIGMQNAEGTLGFRVEWDPKNGAHINVWDNSAPKGVRAPHFTFQGDESLVNTITKRFVGRPGG